jgi:hypothetical protein
VLLQFITPLVNPILNCLHDSYLLISAAPMSEFYIIVANIGDMSRVFQLPNTIRRKNHDILRGIKISRYIVKMSLDNLKISAQSEDILEFFLLVLKMKKQRIENKGATHCHLCP